MDSPLESRRSRAAKVAFVHAFQRKDGLNLIALKAAKSLRTSMGFVTLIDETHQYGIGTFGIDLAPVERAHAFCDQTIAGLEPFVVKDAACDPRFHDNRFVVGEPHIRAYAGVPILDAEGNAVGAVCVAERFARCFKAIELLTLIRLAETAYGILSPLKAWTQGARACRQ